MSSRVAFSKYYSEIAQLGMIGWVLFKFTRRASWMQRLLRHRLWPKTSRYPLIYRPGSSDLDVFSQIFVEREYRCLDGIEATGLILDCGANVGYSSAYFLSRYPKATVIAIEPDNDNWRVLQCNLARYGVRAHTMLAGVWSKTCGLKVERDSYRDGREWSIQVRESLPGEIADIQAVDISYLLKQSGFSKISILKMDIERSELDVFARGFEDWLPHCDAIVIELHDRECETVFFKAIEGQSFEISRCGELTVCLRHDNDMARSD